MAFEIYLEIGGWSFANKSPVDESRLQRRCSFCLQPLGRCPTSANLFGIAIGRMIFRRFAPATVRLWALAWRHHGVRTKPSTPKERSHYHGSTTPKYAKLPLLPWRRGLGERRILAAGGKSALSCQASSSDDRSSNLLSASTLRHPW